MPATLNALLYDIALTAYILAMAAALGHLVGRREGSWRLAVLATQAGWLCHTVAIVVRGVELRRLPILTLPEIVSKNCAVSRPTASGSI